MLRDSLGAEVSHQQTGSAIDVDQAFASFASAGYDLIFAHGFEYQEAAIRAGARFPATTFVVSGGGQASANVVPLVFRLEEGSYLAGMLAAGVSATGVLGMVGGVAIPSVRGTFRAFEAGARVVRPDVRILESFIGNWDDVGAAKDSAAAMLLQGADVLIHNTDAASFGVFQAVREAVEAGDRVWALGMNSNQNEVAPEVTLGSAVIRIPQSFLETARAWQAGTLGGAPLFAGARDDVIDFVVNPALVDQISPDLLVQVREARDRIRSGDLEVPRVPFVEGEPGAGPPTGGTPGA
jgi:basic membrane lipoprotein Med (substrate-binding protein (PBP1-ABC) superfamily)